MDITPDSYSYLIYLSVLFGPFIQEDAATFAAAGLAASQVKETVPLFLTILLGLFLSDIWKYWIGWGALKHPHARDYAERERVMAMAYGVQNNLFKALMFGRFIPLIRIPTYVACGYFKVPYWKFCIGIAVTALLYTIAVFAIVRILGEIMGDKITWILPIIAIVALIGAASFYILKRRKL